MRTMIRLTARCALVALSIVAIALAGTAASVAATPAATIVLPNCAGTGEVRPATVYLACGDGGLLGKNVQWTGWGGTFAAARGTASSNDCTPDCARGRFHDFPFALIADGRERCPSGRFAYARLTALWYTTDPRQVKTLTPIVVSLPCKAPCVGVRFDKCRRARLLRG